MLLLTLRSAAGSMYCDGNTHMQRQCFPLQNLCPHTHAYKKQGMDPGCPLLITDDPDPPQATKTM